MLIEVIIKWALIIFTYPIWWPILKVMYHELQAALWREGGLLGGTPTGRQLEALEERYGNVPSPLISESYAEYKLREEQEEADREWRKKNGISDLDAGEEGLQAGVMRPAARRSNPSSTPGGFGGRSDSPSFGSPGQTSQPSPNRPSAPNRAFGGPGKRGF